MRVRRSREIVFIAVLAVPLAALAQQQPDVAQILKFTPTQPGLVYDTPAPEAYAKCKVELLSGDERGWLVRDGRGLVIRKFVDSNGDNRVDRWSYYMNGQEVYREIDGNFNGKADEFRWYHSAGSRWGLDPNEDGRVDEWKSISPEEATEEVVQAMAAGDFERIRPLLLTPAALAQLGLPAEAGKRMIEAQKKSAQAFPQTARALGSKVQFNRFDGHCPIRVPAEELGGAQDVQLYLNGTVMVEVGDDTRWLRIPELVKVGDVWLLSDLPAPIDPTKPLATSGVLIEGIPDQVESHSEAAPDGGVEGNAEAQEFVEALRKLDAAAPMDGDEKALVAYHVKRAEICARIGSKMQKLSNREHWYKQVADSFHAAAQTGEYDKGVQTLFQYSEQFGKVDWGKTLAAYFLYRAVNAEYAIALSKPDQNTEEVQKAFVQKLQNYIETYPTAPDAADALWQLGNGAEFTAGEEDAKGYYKQLVTKFPESAFAAKAQGALRRLGSAGQPLRLAGRSLGRAPVDTSEHRGKVVLISFWATWCDPCVAEMDRLKRLREKYARSGFEIVGVCLDGDKQKAAAFVQSKGYAWPQLFEEGSMDSKPAVELGIISLPYLVLLDANHNVIHKNLQFGDLEAELEKVMAAKIASKP